MSVLVVGSMALDTIRTPFGEVREVPGGAAFYFSLAASLYTGVRLVGVIGEEFPASHLDLLRKRGVDLSGLERMAGKTFRWSGAYDYDLSVCQTLDTQLNVFADFHPRLPDHFRDTEFVFLANIDPELQMEVLHQIRSARLKALDSMNFWIEGKRGALEAAISEVDLVTLNESEVRELCGTYSLVAAARTIFEMGPKAVIVKKGEDGALMLSPDGMFFAPAFPLETVKDPTGAGDSFAGGFMGFLSTCRELGPPAFRRAVVHGAAVASFTVEDFGMERLARLTAEEVAQRYRQFAELTFFEGPEAFREMSQGGELSGPASAMA